jgi:hypothetical protein
MTQDEKQIKLLEFAGWRQSPVTKNWLHKSNEAEKHFNSAWVFKSDLPDYFNDLNAARELVEILRHMDGTEWYDFQQILKEECGSTMNCIQATASQRAEAIGQTLNLW